MMNEAPRNNTFSFSSQDTVPVKDSAVYQIQKWNFLVKKNQTENELLVWLDELAKQGWELISQPVNLGFYIFKKPAR